MREVFGEKGVYVESRRGAISRDALHAAAQEEMMWNVEERNTRPESFEDSNLRSPAFDPPIHQGSVLHHEVPSAGPSQWALANAVTSVLKTYQQLTINTVELWMIILSRNMPYIPKEVIRL